MESDLTIVPESDFIEVCVVPTPDVVISWMAEIEGFVSTFAYSE